VWGTIPHENPKKIYQEISIYYIKKKKKKKLFYIYIYYFGGRLWGDFFYNEIHVFIKSSPHLPQKEVFTLLPHTLLRVGKFPTFTPHMSKNPYLSTFFIFPHLPHFPHTQ